MESPGCTRFGRSPNSWSACLPASVSDDTGRYTVNEQLASKLRKELKGVLEISHLNLLQAQDILSVTKSQSISYLVSYAEGSL